MNRFSGTCQEFCDVDVAPVVEWIQSIPLSEWPQQDRMSEEYPYPAMVSNQAWHNFGAVTDPLVWSVWDKFDPWTKVDHRMLSIVVPKQRIAEHDDIQSESWRVRIHIPIITNPKAIMYFGNMATHMEVGKAYLVNTEIMHSLENLGDEPRIHLFFDIRE